MDSPPYSSSHALIIGRMSGRASGLVSPRYAHRALDAVPTRRATDTSLGRAELPVMADDSDRASASNQRDTSCSPTPSEIDALEESFCDLGLEPSQAEVDSSQSSSGDIQTTTTTTLLSSRTASTVSSHIGFLQPLSDVTSDSGGNRASPLINRLRTIWRR